MVMTIVEPQTATPDVVAGSAARGALTLAWPERYGFGFPMSHAVLQVTDLAVTAKLLGALDGAAFVTDLATGRPRGGVTVLQRDPTGIVVGRGVTNGDGIATLSRIADSPRPPPITQVTVAPSYPQVTVLEATTADDHVSIALGDGARAIGYQPSNPINVNSLGGNLDRAPLASGAVFPDRAIFRPGEVLHLKGIVRRGTLGALVIPSSDSARLTIQKKLINWNDVDTVIVRDTVLRTSRYGSVVDSVVMRANLPLGAYSARLSVIVEGDWRTVANTDIRLAEFRAPEFLVDVASDTVTRFAGDTVQVGVSARYLLGQPMGRVAVAWVATMREAWPDELTLPWAKGWIVGAPPEPSHGKDPTPLRGVDTLDLNGHFTLRLPVAALQAPFPGVVDVDIGVTDVNRQVITASGLATFSATRLFLLARSDGGNGVSRLGAPVRFEVRAVDEHGAPQMGVSVRVIVSSSRSVPPSPGVAGRTVTDTLVSSTISTGVDPVSITFDPPRAGRYEIALSATDRNGIGVRTAFDRQIASVQVSNEHTGYGLRLFAEKSKMRPGERARVHVVSPFADGDAWVTVEREGVFEQRRVRVGRGDNVITVPIAERYAPNVHVFVAVVPHSDAATRPDSTTERFRAGYIGLAVDAGARKLNVVVATDRRSYQPSDRAAMSVTVRDDKGRGVRSEVAVWAVDEGVLALTGYLLPNVLGGIYRARGVGADLWSSLPTALTTDPTQTVAFLRSAFYGSFAMNSVLLTTVQGPATARTNFRATAFYLGAVETDARGLATVRPRLPDNLTTFRVTAVAMSADDRYGSGDTTLLVTRALAARPALPRFVRPSDSLVAGAVINAADNRHGRARAWT